MHLPSDRPDSSDAPQVDVPRAVRTVAGARHVQPIWENELGGITFQVGQGRERCFVKWTPVTSGIDLSREVARLQWAVAYSPVPRVLAHGDDDVGSWILTAGLPGDSAVTARWRADPKRAVTAIGAGLRDFHDALPLARCPFSWSAEDRIADAHARAAAGRIDPSRWHTVHRRLTVERALDQLAAIPGIDVPVVCQGDACAPNTLLRKDGSWSGHVDLGEMGTADRWADLAIATWSTQWNYGPGWEALLLDAYGVDADPERIAYYRLLWELGP